MTATASLTHHFSSAQEIAQMRGGKETRKGEYQCKCPAHDDRVASLSLGTGRNGDTLINCKAGCDKHDVVKALGLEWSNLFREPRSNVDRATYRPPPSKPAPVVSRAATSAPKERKASQLDDLTHPTLGKPDALYPYENEHGELVYISTRFSKPEKTFRQAQPDGDGGWRWSLSGIETLPFHLPQLIEAIAEERLIFVVEGEKDVLNLERIGIAATTNSGGAKKFPESAANYFSAAHVAIFGDNDLPGQEHAQMVAALLRRVTGSVKVVKLPGLPEKGDISDWLAAGGTSEQLQRLVANTPEWPVVETEQTDALPLATRALDAPPPEPIRWTVEDILFAGELGMLVGDGGSYKSTLALHIACAVAGGYKAFGHFNTDGGAVLVVSAEDSAGVLLSRASAMIRGHGWDRERVLGNTHFFALEGVSLSSAAWCAHLLSEVVRLDARLVVLDPLADLMDGEENSATEMRPVIKAARALKVPTGAAVLLVHHAGKAGNDKRRMDRVRGSSAFHASARALHFIEKGDDRAIKVEPIKLSRVELPPAFMVQRTIETDPANKAVWTLARFDYQAASEAILDQACTFILNQLAADRMNTTQLRDAAKGTGVSGADIGKGLKTLGMMKRIDFIDGDKNAKFWGLRLVAETSKQPEQPENQPSLCLPGKQNDVLATTRNALSGCQPPIGGNQRAGVTDSLATRTSNDDGEAP